jgi:deoxyribodipyrimidine photolyase-related protein
MQKTLRLILGDQLNSNHSWFNTIDDKVTYVLMEIRSETDYATHHIQKVVGFFAAMQAFCLELKSKGHQVIYIKLNDNDNMQSFEKNCQNLISIHNFTNFECQLPDEYRVDVVLKKLCQSIEISYSVVDTEHFFTTRNELGDFFEGKKTFLMESFYRMLRKKHNVLMEGDIPTTGQWNYDGENRKKLPKNHNATVPLVFNNDVIEIFNQIQKTDIKTIGTIDAKNFL